MKTLVNVVAILLIIFGIVTLGYNGFTYNKEEKVAQIGSVQITAQNPKTIFIPPVVSGVSIAVGIILLAIGFRK